MSKSFSAQHLPSFLTLAQGRLGKRRAAKAFARKLSPAIIIVWAFLWISGCASIPGETRQDQVQLIDDLVERTLTDLEKQHPQAAAELKSSVGYVIMSNKITKIPAVGAGTGYGVAINSLSKERTYLRMTQFDLGAGWGARSVRPVLIFQKAEKFKQFIDGVLKARMTIEAAAKVGETGAAGDTAEIDRDAEERGFTSYLLTDAGVSATWTVGVIRVKPVTLKNGN